MRPPRITGEKQGYDDSGSAFDYPSMRPPRITGEKRGGAVVRACLHLPFNEAPANHGGKGPENQHQALLLARPSMRPPRITGEKGAAGISRQLPACSFNEAPANHGGKVTIIPVISRRPPSFNEAPANHGGKGTRCTAPPSMRLCLQ